MNTPDHANMCDLEYFCTINYIKTSLDIIFCVSYLYLMYKLGAVSPVYLHFLPFDPEK